MTEQNLPSDDQVMETEQQKEDLGATPEQDTLVAKLSRYGFILFSIAFTTSCLCGQLNPDSGYNLFQILTCIVALLMLGFRCFERFYLTLGRKLWLADCELSLLILATTQWFTMLLGTAIGSLAQFLPLLLFIIFGAVLDTTPLLITLCGYTLAQLLGFVVAYQGMGIAAFVFIVLAIWCAAFLGHLLFFSQTNLQKLAFIKSKKDYQEALLARAKIYRLLPEEGPQKYQPSTAQDRQLAILTASVKAVQTDIINLLDIFWHSIEDEASSLLFLELNQGLISVKERRGVEAEKLVRQQFASDEGFFAQILRKKEATLKEPTGNRLLSLPYFQEGVAIHAMIALPLLIHDRVSGVLIIHSTKNPMSKLLVDNSRALAQELCRLAEFEGQFNALSEQRQMYNTLSEAASAFNQVMELNSVANVAMDAAIKVANSHGTDQQQQTGTAEFAAITLHTPGEKEGTFVDKIIACKSVYDQHQLLVGQNVSQNSLVASAIKLKIALPERPLLSPRQAIFDDRLLTRELKAARVYPLICQDKAIGTLVVGSAKPDFLSNEARNLLKIIADQAATSITNALLYEKTEQQATTDGLTGLLNHRTFQERFTQIYELSRRNHRGFCFMICDIDHFKQVNDTYGHPKGDEVLKTVARNLKESARSTDIVARYGGEEFAIIMPDADINGACRTAERIRKQISTLVFHSSSGPFQRTISMGIACYPDHKKERQEIINAADSALYIAKESGRNRVVVFGQNES